MLIIRSGSGPRQGLGRTWGCSLALRKVILAAPSHPADSGKEGSVAAPYRCSRGPFGPGTHKGVTVVRRTSVAFLLVALLMLAGCGAPRSSDNGSLRSGESTSSIETTVSADTTAGPHGESLADAILRPGTHGTTGPSAAAALELETYDGGFFTVKKPKGWKIITAGAYGTFGFLLRDPANAARQVFYLGEVSPFYASQKQKDIDRQYTRTGGYAVAWSDMPVVSPLTPARFFIKFSEIATSRIAEKFMPALPHLSGFDVLAQQSVHSSLPIGTTSLIRGYFVQSGVPCEGQFLATVAPYMAFANGPGGGTGIAGHVVGIMAPVSEFAAMENDLAACIDSFRFTDSYVRAGIAQSREDFKGVMAAGQTMRETSAIITDGWEARNRSLDIVSQKRSDATLGYERVYDPATNNVYEVDSGFYDRYAANRGQYGMDGLQPLPDGDYTLWTATPLDGSAIR